MGFTEAECLARLQQAEHRLDTAARTYQRVVLWFEHDCHDQAILARCLSRLADNPLPASLELICIDRHPSIPRFIGLGQLAPEALAGLWPQRVPVTPAQIALGQAIWAALRRPDPSDLAAIAATGTPALPLAAPALRRHLQELPGTGDGLSLTERLILGILAEAPMQIGRMFAAFMQDREPLPFLGDLGFLLTVERMARPQSAILTIESGDKPFPRLASITDIGRQVLAGHLDYLSLPIADRWVGNVRITANQPAWRFDEATADIASPR
jgi:hypothetical protein